MCATCGCGNDEVRVTDGRRGRHDHEHDARPQPRRTATSTTTATGTCHVEPDPDLRTHTLELEVAVLAKNDELAARNRAWLAERGHHRAEPDELPRRRQDHAARADDRRARAGPSSVIEGDQETLFDAERIRRAGARAVQVNTGAGCHLDATMVARALEELQPEDGSILFIENVGNLVCPALFDLGEQRKVVVISVTEGDDKPLKYPHMFAAADLVVLNKTDLLPYVDFDPERAHRATPAGCSPTSRCCRSPPRPGRTSTPGSTGSLSHG